MTQHPPVTRLRDVSEAVRVQPLPSGDERYVDMSPGRLTSALREMRENLKDFDAAQNQFAKVAFTGHRGCGKSTELLRIEHDLAGQFTALHFYATEDEIIADYDYAELFLDLTNELIRQFQEWKISLNAKLAEDIAQWFAEVTRDETEKVKSEITLDAEAELKAKYGLFWMSVGLLMKLKSKIAGSLEKRRQVRYKLQQDPLELIRRFNLLLDNAHGALHEAEKPANLLIVVDNLDRLTPEMGRRLYFAGGDLLKMPRAHMLYTVPISIALSPDYIGRVFESFFTLPMVKVRTREGTTFARGLEALVEVVAKRIDLDAVFASRSVVRDLAKSSGGSIRDLMRLVGYAQLAARAQDKETIDSNSAQRAADKIRLDYEKLLVPAGSYFPLLARIHETKTDGAPKEATPDPAKVESYRVFFSELLTNGSVLEYNGSETWYDVHPVIRKIRAFRTASESETP